MDLRIYIEDIHRHLVVAAEAGGDEARALAERLVAPLDAAVRLGLQDALAAAAEEITRELAPGSVELRLRGRNPEFVVTAAPIDGLDDDGPARRGRASASAPAAMPPNPPSDADDDTMSRINLRLPEQLKARIEQAASAEGVSVNSWLVRAAGAAVERNARGGRPDRPSPHGSQSYTGWAR